MVREKSSSDDDDDDRAWPEEVEALRNIQSGKTRMITQSADEILAELKENEML